MKGVLATMGRELRGYFISPLGWILATALLFYHGMSFATILDYLNNPEAPAAIAPLELFYGGTLFYWMVLLFVASVLTMRLLSEERRSGTLEMLLTAPVTEGQVVLGKFFGALLFYVFLWVPTLLYPLLVAQHTPLDWGPVGAAYVGIVGVGALLLSVGTFTSALTRNQVIAAVLSYVLLFVLFIPAFLEGLVNDPKWKDALQYLNLYEHMDEFAKGVVDSRRLVYYLAMTAFFLFLATRALDAGKGK